MPDYPKLLDALRPLAKPCAKISALPEANVSPFESKFGGVPYIAKGEAWPVCARCTKPMTFICQFDLAEAGCHLPSEARFFTFFYCWVCTPHGGPDWPDEKPGDMWAARLYTGDRFDHGLFEEHSPVVDEEHSQGVQGVL